MDELSRQCVNPVHYDRMVKYLRALNPACTGSKYAMQVINTCIQRSLRENTLITLGMCVSVPSTLYPGKVHLMIMPDRDCELGPIHDPAPMNAGRSTSEALPLVRRQTIEWNNKADNAHHSG